MSVELLEPVVRSVIEQLSRGEYPSIVTHSKSSRLSADNLRQIIDDYGRTLVVPPADAFVNLDAVFVRDAECPTCSIRMPLWTNEEGRSDLTLELTIIWDGYHWKVGLDDLHVL